MKNKYPHPSMEDPDGEMLPLERQKLREWITKKNPSIVFEIGGGLGGGSTMQIANAIADLDSEAVVYSTDPIHRMIGYGRNYFASHPKFKQFVNILGLTGGMLIQYLEQTINADISIAPNFVFFDGPDDAELVYNDFLAIEKLLPVGTWFASHDWEIEKRDYDGATCVKNLMLRPYIEESEKWKLIDQLIGVNGNSDSVGLVLYEKVA